MSALAGLRRFWLNVHLWLGVGLLIPFAILGITGSVLVWHEELERVVEPQRFAVSDGPSLPLAQNLSSTRAAFGDDFTVTAIRPPEHAGDPVVVQARAKGRPVAGQRPETRSAYVDPSTGRVLEIVNTRAGVFGVMHSLHGTLMIPENGRKVVGWLGWAMLVSSLTGLWLWWPRGNFFKGFRWKRGPRTTYNLHHFAGFWLLIPLAALAFTGAYISFPQTARSAVAAMTGAPAPQQQQGGGGGPGGPGGGGQPLARTQMDADTVLAAARDAAPDADIIALTLPTRSRESDAPPQWRVQVMPHGAGVARTVTVDDQTGEVKLGRAPAQADGIARYMRRLHDGTDMPMLWKVLITLAGIAPPLLSITGTIMWLRRRAARRAIHRGHPGGQPGGEPAQVPAE